MDSDGKEGCLILSTRFQWTPTEQIPTWKRGLSNTVDQIPVGTNGF